MGRLDYCSYKRFALPKLRVLPSNTAPSRTRSCTLSECPLGSRVIEAEQDNADILATAISGVIKSLSLTYKSHDF